MADSEGGIRTRTGVALDHVPLPLGYLTKNRKAVAERRGS